MKPSIFYILLCLCFIGQTKGQQDGQASGRISPKELTIPPTPVFDMMGVTSSQVNRTSGVKNFKVDWSFKSWKLSPNLAIESQPVWELFYNRKDLTKYQSASGFMRHLASLDISIGTVQDENNDRRIGFAAKFNIINRKDPLLARDLYGDIGVKYAEEKKSLEIQLKELKKKLDTTTSLIQRPSIRIQIAAIEDQLASENSRRMGEINTRAKIYVEENWNASSLDIAFGKVYAYQTDSSGSLSSLRLNRNTGFGAWMNGSLGIGRKLLLSGLFRVLQYQEQLNFLITDLNTGSDSSVLAIAQNNLFTMGLNLRYGGAIFTFFMEFLYERKGLSTPTEALHQVFKTPVDFQLDASSVKWSPVSPNTISFGGDWRISRDLMLNFGMRCVFTKNWTFTTFTPVVMVSCMMR